MEKEINKKQTFMAGVITIVIAQVVIKLLGLLYRLVITNIPYFGDEGNGLYGAGFQIYTLLLAIATTGIPGAIAKLVSEKRALGKAREAHRIFRVAFALFAVIGLLGTMILFFGARYIATTLIGNPDVEGVLVALSPSIFFVAISAVIRGYFNGMYNMKAGSNSQMIEQFFKSFLTIAIVLVLFLMVPQVGRIANVFHVTEENVTAVMAAGANLASTIAAAIGFVYLYFFYVRRKKEIWKDIKAENKIFEKQSIKKLVKTILYLSIPMSLASVVSAINRNVDTFTVIRCLKVALQGTMSADLIEAEATRLYGILSGKVDMLIGLPLSLNIAFATALVPAVSEAMALGDERTANRRISFSLRTSMLICLPCAIGLCVLADPILKLLFPGAYAPEATILLQISSFTIIFTVLNQTINGSLQGLGKVFVPAGTLALGASIKLIINLSLIPQIGINAAAIGSVACHLIATIIGFIILRKSIKLDLNGINFVLKPVMATALMGASAYLAQTYLPLIIGSTRLVTILAIVVAVAVYLLSLVLLKVFDRDDFHMLPYGDKIYHFLQKRKLV
ncbi:MAG: polysaccharide biosynthesis protein [Clostridia bacterium]|nr:polysaccharide biosynthesis protein [Clostridia bacterium]